LRPHEQAATKAAHHNDRSYFVTRTRLAAAAAALSFALAGCAGLPGSGWQTLVNGASGMENFTPVGTANWHAEDGAIVADKRADNAAAFLVSRKSYRDFELHAEFWISEDANSGIYMRCTDARPITDRSCYEANLFDKRPDPSYGTGAITNYVKVNPMPKAAGRWGTFDITVQGGRISVFLNGVKTAEMDNAKPVDGPIALQYAGGVVKFRKVEVKPI
jgi:hypothetical protein